jgi:prepilin-type N-terminal cleavage/methylation domain-containing protein
MTTRPPDNLSTQSRCFGVAGGARGAFTLLEILVVVVILSILATAIVPRMLNVGQRQAEQEARAVQRLLSIAAEKVSVWNQPVAVDYQADKNTLSVWTQREDAKATADTTGAARVRWSYDPLVEPVLLDRLKISSASTDGQSLASGKWRVTFIPGQPRPVIAVNLEPKSDRDGARWTVTLPADEVIAMRTSSSDPSKSIGSGSSSSFGSQARSIDLDDTGKGETSW